MSCPCHVSLIGYKVIIMNATHTQGQPEGACGTGSIGSIPPADLQRLRVAGTSCELLDVRTPPEHAAAHVAGTTLIPLDSLDAAGYLARRANPAAPLYVFCQGGNRARKAAERFRAAGFGGAVVVEGGTQAWMDAGLPTERGESRVWPLMRQVQVVIGVLTAGGAGLALGVDSRFAVLPLFMGCGLIFAGVSGWCGLALLMARMPWNRSVAAGSCVR